MIRTPTKLNRNVKRIKASTKPARKRFTRIPAQVRFGQQALPPQLFNTLKYFSSQSISVASGASTQLYSCNGLYDPDISFGGHQPLYFDQLMTLYDHYTVLRSRIKIMISSETTLTTTCSCYVDDDTTVSGATVYPERPGAVWETANLENKTVSLYQRWSANRTFGPGTQADPTMQGDANGNPTEQQYYVIRTETSTLTETALLTIAVCIEYDTVFDELKTVALS
jgi:hypothetical protein